MNPQRHKYEYQISPDTAAAKIVRMVGVGKRVLELGAGPGSITRHLQANDCRVTALELDESAIAIVAEFCEAVYRCDLNDPRWTEQLAGIEPFEVIVAGDVLGRTVAPLIVDGETTEAIRKQAPGFDAGDDAVAAVVGRVETALRDAARIDPAFAPQAEALRQAATQIEEVARDLQRAAGRIRHDPGRLAEIEERLALLNQPLSDSVWCEGSKRPLHKRNCTSWLCLRDCLR